MTAAPGVAGERAAEGRRRPGVRRLPLAWAGGLLLAGAGLFTLYLRQSLLGPFNSDGASAVLQAHAMLHGNLLLSGWWTADVSFYTTELPEYVLVTVFRGLRPDVVHIGGALTYTLTVLLGALLARGRATGRAGLVRALLTAGIMLAPAILGGTEVFLENPDHAGTAVPILAVFLLLDRASPDARYGRRSGIQPGGAGDMGGAEPPMRGIWGRPPGRYERWWVPVVVCALLAWTQVGDGLTLVAATAPIAGVAVVRLAMLAVRRRPLAEYRYDALLFAAAAVSYELASLAQKAIRALGGFDLRSLPQQLIASGSEIRGNAHVLLQSISLLFGANSPDQAHPQLIRIAELHWAGLALAAAGLAVAVVTFFLPRTDRVSQIVTAATLATLAAGVFTTLVQSLDHAHEVAILLPFGAVLAGRMLPPAVAGWAGALVSRAPRPPRAPRPARVSWVAWVAGPVLAAWLAASLAALVYAATWAPLGPPYARLTNWLVSHHYTEGLADYWEANSVTVASGGKVVVAPVTPSAGSVRRWEAWDGWYDPAHRKASFVIAAEHPATTQGGGLSIRVVRRYYGRPAREYTVGPYTVMVYDYNLLTRVAQRAFPGTFPAYPAAAGLRPITRNCLPSSRHSAGVRR